MWVPEVSAVRASLWLRARAGCCDCAARSVVLGSKRQRDGSFTGPAVDARGVYDEF